MKRIDISSLPNIKIGHAQNLEAGTGCSVIISEAGATTGVDVRGGAPGTRETDLLNPVNAVDKVHAVFLSGGSAFGLDAAAGIMEYLESSDIGFDVGVTKVPIVCGAVLFDLACGDHRVRPDKAMGLQACKNAHARELSKGNIGAGTGATVGKMRGMEYAMKGGLSHYALQVGDLQLGVIVAVNCLGDVIDPLDGSIIAGCLKDDLRSFADAESIMTADSEEGLPSFSSNTTIAVVMTNATLDKAEATKVSSMAHNGFAHSMRPAHTMLDGDTIFTMSVGDVKADLSTVGTLASIATERAVIDAVKSASSLYKFPAYSDIVI